MTCSLPPELLICIQAPPDERRVITTGTAGRIAAFLEPMPSTCRRDSECLGCCPGDVLAVLCGRPRWAHSVVKNASIARSNCAALPVALSSCEAKQRAEVGGLPTPSCSTRGRTHEQQSILHLCMSRRRARVQTQVQERPSRARSSSFSLCTFPTSILRRPLSASGRPYVSTLQILIPLCDLVVVADALWWKERKSCNLPHGRRAKSRSPSPRGLAATRATGAVAL